jgi:asparagine synthase (glutamine-hydrolysing)
MYGYHRLSINDISFNASQPFEDPITFNILKYPEIRNRCKRRLLCNGEIYNYTELLKDIHPKNLQSKSDVEVILPLYIQSIELGNTPLDSIKNVVNMIDGEWSFILTENINTYQTDDTNMFVGRDIFGTRPLYYITNKQDLFHMFVSELKGIPQTILNNNNYIIQEFPICNIWSFKHGFLEYYNWDDFINLEYPNLQHDEINEMYTCIRNHLTHSIKSRLTSNGSNGDIGILLSGGFDSSLITSIVAKLLPDTSIKLHTFSLVKCNTINNRINNFIEFLETKYNIDIIHHQIYIDEEFTFDLKNKLNDIIYNVETYDPSVIRESILFDLVYKYIKENTNVKVVLSGEGLDELFGDASKTIERIKKMCNFGIPKYDKLAGKYGIEVRFPFLQRDFVEYILKIHPKYKIPGVYSSDKPPIEKYLIRKAFQLIDILPDEITWMPSSKKNCYYGNIDKLLIQLLETIPDEIYNKYINLNNNKTCISNPYCKEAYLYRTIFIKYFGDNFKGIGYSQ